MRDPRRHRCCPALWLVVLLALLGPRPARAGDTWSEPHPGIKRLHRTTSNQNINALVVDLCAPGVSLRATASGERKRTVASFGTLVGAQAVINGDFFSFTDYSTNGLAAHGGAVWAGTHDHTYVAPVAIGANKVEIPHHANTTAVAPWMKEIVSGHPTLLDDGTYVGNSGDPLCTNRHPRTAVGISADHRKLIMVVVDGRASTRIGMTCSELGALLKQLGAFDAVNLDGGGSSSMWVSGTGVVNYPSDGSPRVVANHLGVMATGSGPAPHCPTPPFKASWVGQKYPATMVGGTQAQASVTYRNEGTTAWSGTTRLGTTEPRDRPSPFHTAGQWLGPNRIAAATATPPGGTHTFSFTLTAPELCHETTHVEYFNLVQEGVAWFSDPGQGGPADDHVWFKITVKPAPSCFDAGGPAADAGGPDGPAVDGAAGADGGVLDASPGTDGGAPGDGPAVAADQAATGDAAAGSGQMSGGCAVSGAPPAAPGAGLPVALPLLVGLALGRRRRGPRRGRGQGMR